MDSFARRISTRLCLILLAVAAPAAAQGGSSLPEWLERTELSILAFGDAYWVVDHHDPAVEGENGFWFRRIYLTVDHRLDETFDLRVRLEASSPGDFESSDRLEPFFKDAWLRWRGEDLSLIAGLSPTPTWAVIESFWGYRAVEKTPLDLQRMGSSRDLGLAVQGRVGAGERLRYHAMLGNGSGTRGETDSGKKVALAVDYDLTENLFIEVYGDFEDRDDDEERTTLQAFAGWSWTGGRAGLQVAHQERDGRSASRDLDLASLFAVFDLSDRLSVLGRVDRMFDPNPEGERIAYIPFSDRAESLFVLAGLDVRLSEAVSVIPNVEAVFYDDAVAGADPDDDLFARVTLFVRF